MAKPIAMTVERVDPILRVADMAASLRFYADVLGFANARWGDRDFTCVTRNKTAIYLCRGDQGRGGAWVWIGVDDVGKIHAALEARGIKIRKPPTDYPWAREILVEDPDGNVLRFGSEPRKAARKRKTS